MQSYSVANRYTTKTKLGNWYEEKELDDHDFKEYLYQKGQGANLTLNTTAKIGFSNQGTGLSKRGEELKEGDRIQLWSSHTQGILAFNINEAILGEQTYAVTTTNKTQPALRNVLSFEHAKSDNNCKQIRFGDKVRLTTYTGQRKLYLQSLPVSPMRSSKFSRQQEVSMTATLNSNTLWTIEKVDGKQRFDSIGTSITQGQPIVLKHLGTGQWLASEKVNYINDFGVENQVFGKSFLSNNKTQNLFAQKEGHRNVENPMRSQGVQNQWNILRD